MKNLNMIIAESVSAPRKNFVQEAVNQILGEDISAGQTVAIIDNPVNGFEGVQGRVKSISSGNAGFAEVEMPNGTTIQAQTSLLVPV